MNFKGTLNKNKDIVQNVVFAFIVRGLSMIVSLFTMPAYIRYFQNQTVLGLWFTILSVLNWVLMFDLGLGNGLRNKLPHALAENDYDKARKYISSTYLSVIVLIAVLSALSMLVFRFIPWNTIFNIDYALISHEVLVQSVKIVFIGIMLQFLLKLIASILYALQRSSIVNFLSLLSSVLIYIFVRMAPSSGLEQNLIRMSWVNVFAVNIPLIAATVIIFSTKLKNCRPSFKMYSKKYAREILKIGGVLLWLQIVFMVISSTNEFLISHLTSPDSVVEYQIYFKIFNAFSSIFSLALVPIWSAVTKAHAEKSYSWIMKLYNLLLIMAALAFMVELAIVPFLQWLVNIWLQGSSITVKMPYAIAIAISNSIFVLHNVNTSLGNGMSYFKTQIIWMSFAALVDIPLAYLFVNLTGSWIGVIIANIIALLPYEILEPIYLKRFIKRQFN